MGTQWSPPGLSTLHRQSPSGACGCRMSHGGIPKASGKTSPYAHTELQKRSLAGCVANLILNFFLIPVWGIQGAAIATFMNYYICLWARIIDARYYIPFRFNGINNLLNTFALLIMCWMMIGKPFGYILWTIILLAFIVYRNYKSLLETVRKVLNR